MNQKMKSLLEVSPKGFFCCDNVFNLNRKVLHEAETNVLEKELGFVPTPITTNKGDFRRDFGEFSRKMRSKWSSRDEPSSNFTEVLAF